MALTAVPESHFAGGRAITHAVGGSDIRDLRAILNEEIAQINTNIIDIAANASAIAAMGSPFQYKGSIAAAADFPTAAAVKAGWTYTVTADVIDNDVTKTNTGQAFLKNDEIAWSGTAWIPINREWTVTYMATTPVAVGSGNELVAVQTTTLAAPGAITLPACTAGKVGKQVIVLDAQGDAATYPVTITPDGTDTINGVNAPIYLTDAFARALLVAVRTGAATYGWVLYDYAPQRLIPRFVAADHTAPTVPGNFDQLIQATSAGGAVAINLGALAGYADRTMIVVKDVGGNAAVANITITPNGAELIDGVPAPVIINVAYAGLRFYKAAGGWFTW